MRHWYEKHLGIPSSMDGIGFHWKSADDAMRPGSTTWSVFPEKSSYFNPSEKPVMINYLVNDLEAFLEDLQEKGVQLQGEIQ
jgi:hypothetical protein